MYGSFRFYADKWPADISPTSLINIIDMFSSVLGVPFSRLIHILHNPDEDRPKVYAEYTNNESGRKSFVSDEFIPKFVGKHGEESAPLIAATCSCKANDLYSGISIEVQLPYNGLPMVLRVDFDYNHVNKALKLSQYKLLVSNLYSMGFGVNNSFLHVYRKKNTAITLNGGQVDSLITFEERRNIKQAIEHRRKGNINCVTDVFYLNSIQNRLICEAAKGEIANIVGHNFVVNVGENFIFSLPIPDIVTPRYRYLHSNTIARIREILSAEGLTL